MKIPIKSKFAISILAIIMISLLSLTVVTYWQFNQVIETELLDTMSARTRESANHINTCLAGQLGEVRETVNSPVIDRVLELNPQLDLNRDDESIRYIDQLNLSRWKYVSTVYPNQYAALHIVNYLQPDEWGNPEKLAKLTARYYNIKEGICKTDLWAQAGADEAGSRFSATGEPYDAIFKPAYSQAYGRNMVLMVAWRKDSQGKVVAGAAASLTIETIQQIAQQANFGKKGYEILLAHDGTFVTHPNPQWAMKEKTSSVPDENMQKMGQLAQSAQSGVYRFTENGARKLAFYNPIPVAGWTLVSVVDENELFIPANQLLVHMLVIVAIIIIFTLMSVYIVSLIVNLRRSHAARQELKMRNIELNAAKDRLRNQNIELAEAQEHLISLDRMKDEFLAKVSHELKTPLHGVIGLAECTRDTLLNQSAEELGGNLDMIITSGVRLANLVDEIADFSVLKNNQVRLKKAPVHLQDIVQMVITLETFFVQNKKVKLENRVSQNIPPVYADGERVMQVLHNLVRNAIKFTEEGFVFVTAHVEGDTIRLSVSDTGVGISKLRVESIFNPFEQGNLSGEKIYGGLGLGLSISKWLLELHNSKLTVISEPGKGSCFSFDLPQWHGSEDQIEKINFPMTIRADQNQTAAELPVIECNAAELSSQEEPPGTKRILIVDDEEINLAVVKNCFYGLKYHAVCVKDGKTALAEIENHDYHLVLLDMMMPGLNGLEVCRKIREKYPENILPIIMLTVRNRPEDIEVAFMAKANDYITKPFRKKELLARVQAQLRSKEAYETERRVYQAEICALQAQIQPHFLYNTLNTIIAFCRKDPAKAAEILGELSNYLQNKFRFNNMELIPLEQELDLIQSYLAIEQVRFGKRLHIVFSVETDYNPLIPPLILQPLVENAVKHGVYPKREGGTVEISVHKAGKETIITVTDDGVGMTSEKLSMLLHDKKAQEVGIGLQNIHKRLQKHYGFGLTIQSEVGKGTIITVKIPHQRGGSDD